MAKQINTGGPAFPQSAVYSAATSNIYNSGDCGGEGATLRDYFAAKAMQSFMQGAVLPPGFDDTEQLAFVATRAYEVADSMLKAREK